VIPATLRRRCRETANGFSAKAYLRETHIFHADIALHKSARPPYIPHIKAATAVKCQSSPRIGRRPDFRKDPSRQLDGIRNSTFLLPSLFR
jgi:hypothetical protein